MYYNIAAIPTTYRGVMFRSRLEARWAAFFDIIHWRWEYEPIDFNGWIPDFYVEIPPCSRCHNRDEPCYTARKLYVEVKPIRNTAEFNDPAVMRCQGWEDTAIPAIAIFGINPNITRWVASNCSGGGAGDVELASWIEEEFDQDNLWKQAGNLVQWKAPR